MEGPQSCTVPTYFSHILVPYRKIVAILLQRVLPTMNGVDNIDNHISPSFIYYMRCSFTCNASWNTFHRQYPFIFLLGSSIITIIFFSTSKIDRLFSFFDLFERKNDSAIDVFTVEKNAIPNNIFMFSFVQFVRMFLKQNFIGFCCHGLIYLAVGRQGTQKPFSRKSDCCSNQSVFSKQGFYNDYIKFPLNEQTYNQLIKHLPILIEVNNFRTKQYDWIRL